MRRLEWTPRAPEAYLGTLAHIAEEDPQTAVRLAERIERALSAILANPRAGAAL